MLKIQQKIAAMPKRKRYLLAAAAIALGAAAYWYWQRRQDAALTEGDGTTADAYASEETGDTGTPFEPTNSPGSFDYVPASYGAGGSVGSGIGSVAGPAGKDGKDGKDAEATSTRHRIHKGREGRPKSDRDRRSHNPRTGRSTASGGILGGGSTGHVRYLGPPTHNGGHGGDVGPTTSHGGYVEKHHRKVVSRTDLRGILGPISGSKHPRSGPGPGGLKGRR